MTISLPTESPKKLLYILTFFVVLYLMMEMSGLRSNISPGTIKEIFLHHTILGLFFFCLAYSLGNLVYIPGWIFLVGAVFALGNEWGGMASKIVNYLNTLWKFEIHCERIPTIYLTCPSLHI